MPRYVVIIFQSIKQDGAGGFGQVGYDIASELHRRGEEVMLYTINKGPFETQFPTKAVLFFPRSVLWLINKMMDRKLIKSVAAYKIQEFLFDYCLSKRALGGELLITTFPLLPRTLKRHHKNFKKSILIPQNPDETYIKNLYDVEFKRYTLPKLKADAYNDAWRIRKQQQTLPYLDEVVSISGITHKSYELFGNIRRLIPYYVKKDLGRSVKANVSVDGKFVYLFLAHIVLLKGLHHLMDAWMRWANGAAVELWVVGGIDSSLKDSLNKSFPAKNIKWLGYRSDIKTLIQQSDVVVIPSLVDNEPQTTVEALSLCVPVIMSDGCGNADWLKEIMPEAIYPVGDITALAEKLRYFHDHHDEVDQKSQRLYELVLQKNSEIIEFTSKLINC